MAKQISYTTRDFQNVRTELINFVKSYYPDLIQNVNDASVFSVFLDLNAAVTDNLHYHIDRSLQETVLQYAQQRSSIYNIARTYGLKIPGQRPSVAMVDFSITLPPLVTTLVPSSSVNAVTLIDVTVRFGIYFSTESLISDSISLNVGPSKGSKMNSYNLVPKSCKNYLLPLRVNNKCIKLLLISSSVVSDKSKYFPSNESLKGKLIPYVLPFAI